MPAEKHVYVCMVRQFLQSEHNQEITPQVRKQPTASTTECLSRRQQNRAAGCSSERISAGEPDCALLCGICSGWRHWVEGHVQHEQMVPGAFSRVGTGSLSPWQSVRSPVSSIGCGPSFPGQPFWWLMLSHSVFYLLFLNDIGDLFMFVGYRYPFKKIYSSLLLIFLLCCLLFFLTDFLRSFCVF